MEMPQPDQTKNPSNIEFFTAAQVAKMMQVRESTVRTWLHCGQIRGVRIGRTWRISRAEIEAFAATSENR